MAADNKFGTFGGVFTPSILTILGVIMYMRLPRIVGEAGLFMVVGIILAAHLISVTTGLSVSSIATDKKVEAGGAYYIVSRSMGLSMGGTIGIALFVGLSFSISLYIIGFTQSVLDYFKFAADLHAIRVWGTVTLLGLTAITFISTSLAIKTQYLILLTIAASLVSIFMGSWDVPPVAPLLHPHEGGEAATVLFGIFFPAVTGFTAGVNMSGDLREPKKSIPIGTVVAIAVGLVVYLGLAVFLAYKVPGEALREDPAVLLKLAWSKRAVVAGIWGATLSSALGSILGAPRILQALSLDKITPGFLGIGAGPTREPRYALFVAFAIGEVGILIGELDSIARIVSIFFLATYGFLNLSASFEMIASPDFRPQFRIPRMVPVVGAIASAVLMIWLDLAAMLGAVTVMSMLFAFLKRRELELDTGDALLGVWFSVVRTALYRLSRRKVHQRNWVPNILAFTHLDAEARLPLLEFGHSLTRQRGVFNELALATPSDDPTATYELRGVDPEASEATLRLEQLGGFFSRRVPVQRGRLFETMSAATSFHGVDGLRHNTVMVDWHEHASESRPFAAYLNLVGELDLNIMCLGYEGKEGFAKHRRIDLWWSPRAGNIHLNLALMRFVTATDEWEGAEIRFFLISDEGGRVDALYKGVTRAVEAARVNAQVKVVNNAIERRTDDEWIVQHSAQADLTVVGIPHGPLGPEDVQRLERLGRTIGAVLLLRASSQFQEELFSTPGPASARQSTLEIGAQAVELPRLLLSLHEVLAEEAKRFSAAHGALAAEAASALIKPGAEARAGLLAAIREAVGAQYGSFEHEVWGRHPTSRERLLTRGGEQLLGELGMRLSAYMGDAIVAQQASAERGIERLVAELKAIEAAAPAHLSVRRPLADFAPAPEDPPHLRRLKSRRRLVARLRGGTAPCRVWPRRLRRYYCQHATVALCQAALQDDALQSAHLRESIQNFLTEIKASLTRLHQRSANGGLQPEFIAEEGAQLVRHLVRLEAAHESVAEDKIADLVRAARALQQAYAEDLDLLDLRRVMRRSRRVRRADRQALGRLGSLPEQWAAAETLALRGPILAAQLAIVQGQLSLAVRRTARALQQGIAQGPRATCAALAASLDAFAQRVEGGELVDLRLDVAAPAKAFDVLPLAETLRQAVQDATASLPEAQLLLREPSLLALASDPFCEVESAEIRVRQLVQVAVDAQLLRAASEILQEVPRAGQRATTIMEDVVRLVGFHQSELAATEGQEIADLQAVLRPVVENGVGRVDAELVRLDALGADLDARLGEALQIVVDHLDSYAIRGSVEGFEVAGDPHQAGRLSGVARALARLHEGGGRALVKLAYRESTGVLLARRLQAPRQASGHVDGVLNLVDALSPRAAVRASLPFYYQQLFLANASVPAAFWVGRAPELAEIGRAITRYQRGFSGPIVVTGDPGSGKSALIEVALDRFLSERAVYRVSPPPGGSVSLAAFEDALRRAFGLSGSSHEILQALPSGSVVVLQELELWWERSDQGHVVLEHLLELIGAHSQRCLFLLEVGAAPLHFMRHFLALSGEALAEVECGPVDAETIKDIVTLRHRSTGLTYVLGHAAESALSEFARARLFTAHFHRSQGNIGAALGSWIAGITACEGDQLRIALPEALDDDPMGGIPPGCLALLLQLELHKRLTPERLAALSQEPDHALQADLARLRRMGLVGQTRRDRIEVAPAARNLVHRYLKAGGLLP